MERHRGGRRLAERNARVVRVGSPLFDYVTGVAGCCVQRITRPRSRTGEKIARRSFCLAHIVDVATPVADSSYVTRAVARPTSRPLSPSPTPSPSKITATMLLLQLNPSPTLRPLYQLLSSLFLRSSSPAPRFFLLLFPRPDPPYIPFPLVATSSSPSSSPLLPPLFLPLLFHHRPPLRLLLRLLYNLLILLPRLPPPLSLLLLLLFSFLLLFF